MSCKKLINHSQTAVDEAIEGLALVNNNLGVICNGRVVIRKDVDVLKRDGKVALVTGGGSGHEPAWAGYVGPGMLTAAVCGNVFASPPTSTVYEAIVRCGKDNPAGVLVIVKNYTGDRVNFGLAIERAKATGIKCEMVVAAEDCALMSSDRSTGRRGLCGALFIHKVAGAMAEAGCNLDDIVRVAENVNSEMGTLGVSLGPCSLPGAKKPLFDLPQDTVELGLGIHGEAGVMRMPLTTCKEIVRAQLDHMTNPSSPSCLPVHKGDRVAVIINNLGGTSCLELSIVAREILKLCEERGIVVARSYCGTFCTSLEMPGVSITLLKVSDSLLEYLDTPTDAPSWCRPWRSDCPPSFSDESPGESEDDEGSAYQTAVSITADTAAVVKAAILSACDSLLRQESHLNDLDKGCGDGDTGSTFVQGCQALMEYVNADSNRELSRPALLLSRMSSIIEHSMGGTSGALYSLLLSAAAADLIADVSPDQVVRAFSSGIRAVMKYGRGQAGDRTMLDALIPSLQALQQPGDWKSRLEACAKAARAGADSTAGMRAKSGRASYTPVEQQARVDPGAEAVAIWVGSVCERLQICFMDFSDS